MYRHHEDELPHVRKTVMRPYGIRVKPRNPLLPCGIPKDLAHLVSSLLIVNFPNGPAVEHVIPSTNSFALRETNILVLGLHFVLTQFSIQCCLASPIQIIRSLRFHLYVTPQHLLYAYFRFRIHPHFNCFPQFLHLGISIIPSGKSLFSHFMLLSYLALSFMERVRPSRTWRNSFFTSDSILKTVKDWIPS